MNIAECLRIINEHKDRHQKKATLESTLKVAQQKMGEIIKEQELIEKAQLTLSRVKPLLSQSAIKECEKLANAAIEAVFESPYKVKWSIEMSKFVLDKGDYETDLTTEGGGLISVVSFVFSIYLLVKMNKRRFLAFDEQFTQLSDDYLDRFLDFLVTLCKDLKVDLLLITHDGRIDLNQVDHAYRISRGHTYKEK